LVAELADLTLMHTVYGSVFAIVKVVLEQFRAIAILGAKGDRPAETDLKLITFDLMLDLSAQCLYH